MSCQKWKLCMWTSLVKSVKFCRNKDCGWSFALTVWVIYGSTKTYWKLSSVIPLQAPLMCRFLAARWAERTGGHRYTSAGVCPAHGNPHMISSPASSDPVEEKTQQRFHWWCFEILCGLCILLWVNHPVFNHFNQKTCVLKVWNVKHCRRTV